MIIQEGVPTYEARQRCRMAEPVVYMLDRYIVGGFAARRARCRRRPQRSGSAFVPRWPLPRHAAAARRASRCQCAEPLPAAG